MDNKIALTQIFHEIVQFQHKLNEMEASPEAHIGGFKPVIPLNS